MRGRSSVSVEYSTQESEPQAEDRRDPEQTGAVKYMTPRS